MQHKILGTLVALVTCALTSIVNAQWTVTNLHPAGAKASRAYSTNDGQIGGYVITINSTQRAALWNGASPSSWVDLSSGGYSQVWGMEGNQQVGSFDGVQSSATLWSGTAASRVTLNPAGAIGSHAFAIGDGQQVGNAYVGTCYHASLWSGTAASWVDLNPTGTSACSSATGVSAGQQVGVRSVGNVYYATLWSGAAASWVNLNPAGSTESAATRINNGQEVGRAKIDGYPHASLWTGTADSWVDLNPDSALYSEAYGVYAGRQVGQAFVNGQDRAALWSGTSDSWVNLGAFLSPDFSESTANSIWSDDNFIYVAGSGYNTVTNRYEALLWTQPVPEPFTAMLIAIGILTVTKRRCRNRLGQATQIC